MAPKGPLAFREDYTQLMGTFQSMWGSVEIVTDYAICKFLKVTPGQAHLITAGMLFGRKGRLLADLISRSDDPKKDRILGAFNNVWPAPSASDFVEYAVIGLLQRIRPQAQAPAKMEIRASRSS